MNQEKARMTTVQSLAVDKACKVVFYLTPQAEKGGNLLSL